MNFINLTEINEDFSLSETLESGQYFRYEEEKPFQYTITSGKRLIRIGMDGGKLCFDVSLEEFNSYWLNFFDLERNYSHIKKTLEDSDFPIKYAIKFAPGIRIINQDPWECLLCFIISQNNRIPMIKQTVKNISENFGTTISEDGKKSLPSPEVVASLSEGELRACKTGFRAKYIIDCAKKVSSGQTDIYNTSGLETDSLRQHLMQINGVGQKIADCVMLFSMGRRDVFPTDVWIKRVMQKLYFNSNETSIKHILELARSKFGKYAGYAQQYLYHYARLTKLKSGGGNF